MGRREPPVSEVLSSEKKGRREPPTVSLSEEITQNESPPEKRRQPLSLPETEGTEGVHKRKKPLFEYPEETEDSEKLQREALQILTSDPGRINAELKKLCVDGETLSKVVQDVRNNPEAQRELNNIASNSNLQENVRASLSKGKARGRGNDTPKRKELLQVQRNMKRAMRQAREEDPDVTHVMGVHINSSRKAKSVQLNSGKLEETAIKLLPSSSSHAMGKLTLGLLVIRLDDKRRNRRLEKILGERSGSEAVFYRKDGASFSVEDFEALETSMKLLPSSRTQEDIETTQEEDIETTQEEDIETIHAE